MINLDERYHDLLDHSNNKKIRIDGIEEHLIGYGWHCDGNEIQGYYLTTENYKIYYDMNQVYQYKEKHGKVAVEAWPLGNNHI